MVDVCVCSQGWVDASQRSMLAAFLYLLSTVDFDTEFLSKPGAHHLVKFLVSKSWDPPEPDPSPIDVSQAIGMLGSQTQVLILVWQTLSNQDTYQVAVRHFLSPHMYRVYGRPQDTRVLINPTMEHIPYCSHVPK